jgi:hypothetical protein
MTETDPVSEILDLENLDDGQCLKQTTISMIKHHL